MGEVDDWAADRAVIEAATPGPWEYGADDWRGRVQDRFWFVSGDVRESEPDHDNGETDESVEGQRTAVGVLRVERNLTSHPACENNARFVCQARTRWPAALDDRDRQQARADAAEARVAELERLLAAAMDRIGAQSELLSRRAEADA